MTQTTQQPQPVPTPKINGKSNGISNGTSTNGTTNGAHKTQDGYTKEGQSDLSHSIWAKIEKFREHGKVLLNGTDLDIASVIAVAKYVGTVLKIRPGEAYNNTGTSVMHSLICRRVLYKVWTTV